MAIVAPGNPVDGTTQCFAFAHTHGCTNFDQNQCVAASGFAVVLKSAGLKEEDTMASKKNKKKKKKMKREKEMEKESSTESSPHSSVDVVEETKNESKRRRAEVAPKLDEISKRTDSVVHSR